MTGGNKGKNEAERNAGSDEYSKLWKDFRIKIKGYEGYRQKKSVEKKASLKAIVKDLCLWQKVSTALKKRSLMFRMCWGSPYCIPTGRHKN